MPTHRIANRNYILGLLTIVLVFNYADRLIFGVLLQDIKTELSLTDTQLGFLTGIAFAFFYAVMGIPIARWADRGNRVTIISLAIALWSAAVALCGAATSFIQLLLIRVGVAVGEAGCYPSSLSLIADHFPRAERPRAVARFMLGVPLALIVGYFSAGWLNEIYGWRITLVAFGLPGLVIGALTWFTLADPRERSERSATLDESTETLPAAPVAEFGFKEVLCVLWANRAYRHLLLCFSVWGFFGNGILQWQPAFFVRSHGLQTGELGTWFAVVYGVAGLVGTYVGGELASRYAANNERLQLRVIAVLYAFLSIFTAGTYLAVDHELAFGILSIGAVIGGATNGPLFASTQTVVPPRMRAMSIALMYLFCNLIGLGLGPLAVGALSDELRPRLEEESLRYALLAFCPGYIWAAWHAWRAGRYYLKGEPDESHYVAPVPLIEIRQSAARPNLGKTGSCNVP